MQSKFLSPPNNNHTIMCRNIDKTINDKLSTQRKNTYNHLPQYTVCHKTHQPKTHSTKRVDKHILQEGYCNSTIKVNYSLTNVYATQTAVSYFLKKDEG